jgi:hypothetical protein
MQAFAIVVPQVGAAAGLVVPGLLGSAWLQGGEDPYQPGMRAALLEHGLDLVFFVEVLLADIVEYAAFVEIGGHAIGVAEYGQSSLYHHAVVTGQRAGNLLAVTFRSKVGDPCCTCFEMDHIKTDGGVC